LRAKLLNLTLVTASFLGHSLWKFLSVFPRTVVERGDTVTELQATPLFNLIDFGRLYGCHRMEHRIHVTSLTEQLADCNLASIEHIHPTIEAAWAHGLAECQIKHVFRGMMSPFKILSK
jgi:hypothetical protein